MLIANQARLILMALALLTSKKRFFNPASLALSIIAAGLFSVLAPAQNSGGAVHPVEGAYFVRLSSPDMGAYTFLLILKKNGEKWGGEIKDSPMQLKVGHVTVDAENNVIVTYDIGGQLPGKIKGKFDRDKIKGDWSLQVPGNEIKGAWEGTKKEVAELAAAVNVTAKEVTKLSAATNAAITTATTTTGAPASGAASPAALKGTTDWLQWGGPERNFHVPAARLAKAWPDGGPKKLWSRPLGEGFTAVLAEGDRLYTAFRRGQQEVIVAMQAATGRMLWERPVDAPAEPADKRPPGAGPGPYSTPLIVGARLFFTASNGRLYALDKRSGRVLWEQDLWRKHGGSKVDPGYTSSPLAWKETVIVPVGGPGRGLICFRQKDGSVVWKKLDFESTFASPILINVDGQSQVVSFMQKEVIGVDPETGDLLWKHPHQTLFNVNASTPVWGSGNILFISTAYNGGGRAIQLAQAAGKTEVKELWNLQRMRIHHTNAIRLGDHIYASNGDFGPAPLTCINVTTGQIEWQSRRFGKANLIAAGNYVIVLDESGKVALSVLSPKGLEVLAETEVLTSTAWTAPTLAGNKLYVRDHKEIAAFNLGE